MSNKVKILEGQTFIDLAIQKTGSPLAAFELAVRNNASVTDEIVPGQSLDLGATVNVPIKNYYEVNGLKPSTSELYDEDLDIDRIFATELPLEFE